ncbi:kinase-like protein [Auricularia subglabra TFB-10046 SS5]|nr:kinase-like protein [Auricularia subglabra TFB-10046 SS5]
MSSSPPLVGDGRFRVGKRCSAGDFGAVFEGTNITNGQAVALKFEWYRAANRRLRYEYKSYKLLTGMPGLPKVYYFGREGSHYVLIMEMLGRNLEHLFYLCGGKFSIKTVCMLAKEMITRVQAIHERALIYRNVQPDTFLMGPEQTKAANVVHLVDFGLAKPYRDSRTGVHMPYREAKSPRGDGRYMSINTHLCVEQSRRDDLEALGHVLLYFLRGSLPWQGVRARTNQEKHEKVVQIKSQTQIRDLCVGFPDEFAVYLEYARGLGFDETPDYEFLRDLFTKALQDLNEVDDGVFDWMQLKAGAAEPSPGLAPLPHVQRGDTSDDARGRQHNRLRGLRCFLFRGCKGRTNRTWTTRVHEFVSRLYCMQ